MNILRIYKPFRISTMARSSIKSWLLGGIVLLQIGCREGIGQGNDWPQAIEKAFIEGNGNKGLEIANSVVQSNPKQSYAYLVRGMVHFRLAKIDESIVDFDRSIELDPASGPDNWQRGISLYYAKKYEEGKKQFETHRTVNPNDVENSVWHFLCHAKVNGIEAARKDLIPIEFDPRPPMMLVLQMFRGEVEPQKLVEVIEMPGRGPQTQKMAKFYGYLYLGLYHEALGESGKAEEYLKKSLEQKMGGYMADVARIDLELRKKNVSK